VVIGVFYAKIRVFTLENGLRSVLKWESVWIRNQAVLKGDIPGWDFEDSFPVYTKKEPLNPIVEWFRYVCSDRKSGSFIIGGSDPGLPAQDFNLFIPEHGHIFCFVRFCKVSDH